MIITSIDLEHYRNYEKERVSFSKGMNFILGQNAQGKTNLLEGVYLGGYGKSFRTNKDKQLISQDEEYGLVRIHYQQKMISSELFIRLYNNKKKEIFYNSNLLERRSELFGLYNVVLFSPEELKLVKEGPAQRRRFLDRELSQLSKVYYHHLVTYLKIIDQRNAMLKDPSIGLDMVSIYDDQLIHHGLMIIKKRLDFIEKLGKHANRIHKEITKGKESLNIKYFSNLMPKNSHKYDKIEEEYSRLLSQKFDSDKKYGYTTIGPHRDDLEIRINGIDVRTYGSQGQVRLSSLSIILGLIYVMKEEIDEYPILLLDDVLSELDSERKNMMLTMIESLQSIITATDLEGVAADIINKSHCINIKAGKIIGG